MGGKALTQILEDAKKWREHDFEYCNLKEWRERQRKNRQIIKDIKKVINKTIEEDGFIEPENGLIEIQKILEGKK